MRRSRFWCACAAQQLIIGMCMMLISSVPIPNGIVPTSYFEWPPPLTERVCEIGVADYFIIVDGSTSIGEENFQIIREWLSTVALQLPEEARFATVQFTARAQVEWKLNRYSTPQEFSEAFLALQYIRGTTRASLGLQTLLDSVLHEGNRIDYPDIVIVITDGRSADDPASPAERLRSLGATTFALGITSLVDDRQLLSIAGSTERVFRVKSFDDLFDLTDELFGNVICRVQRVGGGLLYAGERDVSITCGSHGIRVSVATELNFDGHIYVKGHFEDEACRVAGNNSEAAAGIYLQFGQCNMTRLRTVEPSGILVRTTVVVKFHPTFLTKIDRAYAIECFYMEADKTVEQLLNVSSLSTIERTEQFEMPVCTYSIHSGSPDGPLVRFSVIGQKIYHKWQCDNSRSGNLMRMRVVGCSVQNAAGDETLLLDRSGCTIDVHLLPNLVYSDNGMMAFTQVHAFRYADASDLYFQCEVQLCVDLDGGCDLFRESCSQQPSRLAKRAVSEQYANVDVRSGPLSMYMQEELGVTHEQWNSTRSESSGMCIPHIHLYAAIALSAIVTVIALRHFPARCR